MVPIRNETFILCITLIHERYNDLEFLYMHSLALHLFVLLG